MLSLSELRRALAARGLEFSDSQLKRLRRDGLLPVGDQRHRGGVRGSESLYPAWAVDQLELVSRLSAGERRFAQLRVLVRWHGGWVRPDQLRAAMVELLEPISAAARRVAEPVVDQTDRADRLAQDMAAHPGRSGISRLMQQRLNNVAEDIERTMYAFAALATRSPVEWENHDPENPTESLLAVVERAFGIDRARQDDIGGQGPLMRERESSEQMLVQLQEAGAFDLLDLAAAFTEASDEAIERALEDAIAFAGMSGAFEAIESIAGQDVAGLGSVSELGRAEAVIDRVMLVRGLLLIRPLVPDGALEKIVQAASDAGPQLGAAQALARALPQHAWLLGARGAERLAALPAAERDKVIGEIRAFLDAHPDLAAMARAHTGGTDAEAPAIGATDAVRAGDRACRTPVPSNSAGRGRGRAPAACDRATNERARSRATRGHRSRPASAWRRPRG